MIHVVQPGETIEEIASQYGVATEQIIFQNQLSGADGIVNGQALLVLIPEIVHEVVSGDTLYTIAEQYGVSVKDIRRNNPGKLLYDEIYEGEELVIQYENQQVKRGAITTNGYVYPFVNEEVYRETLLYLTTISIFSYGFTTAGDLIPIDDEPLIAIAYEYDVKPILVLTPFTDMGVFSNALVNALVNDMQLQNTLIENLMTVVTEKGYAGVDIDFEYILPEDRDAYVAFVQNITSSMNDIGKTVSVALAPKTSVDQPGLLYEGIDYAGLGNAANSVLCMTYEWGYT